VLNAGAVIQCHSLEDGTFKSDCTVIGSGAVLGVAAFVHYGVAMGEGTVLDADAFLMKGEMTAPFTHWGGNPATESRSVSRSVSRRGRGVSREEVQHRHRDGGGQDDAGERWFAERQRGNAGPDDSVGTGAGPVRISARRPRCRCAACESGSPDRLPCPMISRARTADTRQRGH
jgi:hypothetical protein